MLDQENKSEKRNQDILSFEINEKEWKVRKRRKREWIELRERESASYEYEFEFEFWIGWIRRKEMRWYRDGGYEVCLIACKG